MTNITALLLVLTLTGAPVTSVVCVAECQHEPVTSGHCHGEMATADGPMMFASNRCNDLSASGSPFVVEHRVIPGTAVLAATLLPTTLELVRIGAPRVLVKAADAWLKLPLVLRL